MTDAELVEKLIVIVESGKLSEDEADAVTLAARIVQRKQSSRARMETLVEEVKTATNRLAAAARSYAT